MNNLEQSSGILYVISTPIGNLEDITQRALRVLAEVNYIAAEDTRRTRQLLTHFNINAKLISYHSFNEHQKTDSICHDLAAGQKVAVVSDAGTPAVADPGFFIVRQAAELGIKVEIIPGVSALTFAASAAALPVDRFSFYGFAPVKSGRKQKFFEEIAAENKSVFFFESPYRVEKTLLLIEEIMGPERQVAIIREATKIHEEVIRGKISEINAANAQRQWKGEFVIGVAPAAGKNFSGEFDE